MLVGDTGIEPVTSSVSRKRSPTELIARACLGQVERWRRDLNPCRRICSPLPRLSATPPRPGRRPTGDDGGWSPSGRRDSNPRPSPWQGDALPTEPRPRCDRSGFPVQCVWNTSRTPPTASNRYPAPRVGVRAHPRVRRAGAPGRRPGRGGRSPRRRARRPSSGRGRFARPARRPRGRPGRRGRSARS